MILPVTTLTKEVKKEPFFSVKGLLGWSLNCMDHVNPNSLKFRSFTAFYLIFLRMSNFILRETESETDFPLTLTLKKR